MQNMDRPKPLIVVLGIGEMGMVHARNLSKVRSVRVGIASSRPDALASVASAICADATYGDYDSALSDEDVTAVVISTPPATHPEIVERAAEAGKHIFCEKPLGVDATSARKAQQLVQGAGVHLVLGFMRRWDDAYAVARERVASGKLGDVTVLKCTSGDADYPEKYHRSAVPYALLKDLSVHDVDLARWFANCDVHRVYAILDALNYPALREHQDGDVGIVVLEMASGVKAVLHLGRALHYGYNVSTEIVCQKGTLRVGDLGHTDLDEMSDQRNSRTIDPDYRARFVPAFEKEMRAFADLVLAPADKAKKLLASDDRYTTGEDGVKATVVAEAMVRSVETGLPVDVNYD